LILTGSDVHHPSVGAYAWTVPKVPNITYEGIMTELRAKRTSFYLMQQEQDKECIPKVIRLIIVCYRLLY